ncbi:MAG: sulfatase-like hydrolase/transferase [Chitinophagaceae bacterium]|nr:sulfatase-like hydrolase/transferase [Chitinophagaceae bacterium]
MRTKYLAAPGVLAAFLLVLNGYTAAAMQTGGSDGKQPNILFVISDDQAFPYASAYGTTGVNTPAFDQVARMGILFNNAFAAAPQCSPSRAAILTGKNIWQLEEAGTHGSYFPKNLNVFTGFLEAAGYKIGYTGKAWAPGNWKDAGWQQNPVGPEFNDKKLDPPTPYISTIDYAANFRDFYAQKKKVQPFFFWLGTNEPHRRYEEGSGKKNGKDIKSAYVPAFLPPDSIVKSDIEDYAFEIEWFDKQLQKVLDYLQSEGELENTLIVVTSDNGMPFPSAKANLMEYGTHVPLAISWPAKIRGGRVSDELVSLIDMAPTFLEVAGIHTAPAMTGKSLAPVLFSNQTQKNIHRSYVLTGRERHSHARPDNLGYPSRAIRTQQFLYILNCKPERWPAGDPPPSVAGKGDKEIVPQGGFKPIGMGYNDIDDPSPTKELMLQEKDKWPLLFTLGFEKRPADQLYDIKKDPACIYNLAGDSHYDSVKNPLKALLTQDLTREGDPRMLGFGDIFESYPRFGLMRNFPGFKEQGKYNPAFGKSALQKKDPDPVPAKDKMPDADDSLLPRIPVIIIMADQLRFDAVGKYTPHINSLKDEGISFNRAYCASPICVPSRGAFFTGRYPNNNGSLLNGWEKSDEHFREVKSGTPNLYETMGRYWDSWHVGKQHFFTEDKIDADPKSTTKWIVQKDYKEWIRSAGVQSPGGREYASMVPQLESGQYTHPKRYTIPKTGIYKEGLRYYHDDYFGDRSVEIINRHTGDKPLLLNTMFLSPHPPFSIPEPYFSRIKPGELVLPGNVGVWYNDQSPLQLYNLSGFIGTRYSRSDWEKIWPKYFGLVNLLDDEVGKIINALKKKGWYDKALIIFTADHGEMLGSHSLWQKSCMYEEAARVPLIIKFPGSVQYSIRATDELVSLVDVWPTLKDFLQIETGDRTDGISLMPLVRGKKLNRSQIFIQYDGNAGYGNNQRCVIEGNYKLIVDSFKDEIFLELYNVIDDPQEKKNLAGDPAFASLVRKMTGYIKKFMRDTGDMMRLPDTLYETFINNHAF